MTQHKLKPVNCEKCGHNASMHFEESVEEGCAEVLDVGVIRECNCDESIESVYEAALSAAYQRGFEDCREQAAKTCKTFVAKSYNEKLMTDREQISAAIRALQPESEKTT